MTSTTRPTVAEVESYAPELWELTDRYAEETLQGRVDFDLEIFDAIDSLLQGESEAAVLSKISPEHPGAAEAVTLLRAHLSARRWLNRL